MNSMVILESKCLPSPIRILWKVISTIISLVGMGGAEIYTPEVLMVYTGSLPRYIVIGMESRFCILVET